MNSIVYYFGGKWTQAPWIIEQFPPHELYVEVFGGGGSVLLQKQPSKHEVYNDIDDEMVNLFAVARDHGALLVKKLELTPYSRTEYYQAFELTEDPIERARRTIIKSRFGIADSIFIKRGFRTRTNTYAKEWRNYWFAFQDIIERLQDVVIENYSWERILEIYDSPTTLFYLDPPYVTETRAHKSGYRFEFTDQDHQKLLAVIPQLKGMVILSGYDSELYRPLDPWKKMNKEIATELGGKGMETLWISPHCEKAQTQISMAL